MTPPVVMNDIERLVREAGPAGMRCNAIAQARDALMQWISRPLRVLIRDGRLAKLVVSHRHVVYFAPEFAPPAAVLNPAKETPPKQKPGPKPKPIQKAKPIQAQGGRQRRPSTSIRNANTAFLACEPVITADTKITRAEPFVDRRFVGETPPGWVGQITRDWLERRLEQQR